MVRASSAATSPRPYRRISTLGFSTRHLGPVQMTTDTALGVAKRVIVDCDYSFLPTIFPQRLADSAMHGINSSVRGDSIRCSSLIPYAYAGWLFALDINLPGAAW
ncbi:hypothetical protein V8E52_006827 [Russula decolorans]